MSWAESYLAIPFAERGQSRTGCDCWGLVRLILAEQRGVDLPAYAEIGDHAVRAKVRAIREAAGGGAGWREIAAGAEDEFDAVLMRGIIGKPGRRVRAPLHIGVVTRPGMLIHIEQGVGVSLADYRRHPALRSRVLGFYRYAGAA
jgi:cell wall-associated NlpC family hydrolase